MNRSYPADEGSIRFITTGVIRHHPRWVTPGRGPAGYSLILRNGALSHRQGAHDDADVSVTIDRSELDKVILGETTLPDQIAAGTAQIAGDADALQAFIGLLDTFEFGFNIVTP